MKSKINKIDHKSSGWIVPYMLEQGIRFLFTALLGTLAVASAGGLLFTSGYLISRSSLQPENILMVYVPIVLVRTFGFSKAVLQYLERLLSHDTVLRIVSRMRVRLYNILEPHALHFRSRFRTGDILGLLAEDIEQLQHVYLRLILPSTTAVLLYAGGVAALGHFDATFAWFMALYCGFLLFTLPAFTLFRSRKRRRQFIIARSTMYQELTDAIFGMSDWILSGRKHEFLRDFDKKQTSWMNMEKRLRREEWLLQWLSQIGIGLAVVFMAIWAGNLAYSGRLEAEWIAAFTLVTFPLLEALIRAGEAINRTPDYAESLQRLQQVEKTTESKTTMLQEQSMNLSSTSRNEPAITLSHVYFRYNDSHEWSIYDVSLQIPQGGKTAVIGRSGAGKSTLLNLIQGELKPDKGTIQINDAIKDTVATINDSNRHLSTRLFAVLNQKPYLFDTTVINNIRMGNPDASDDQVRKAAELAGLSQLIHSLPQGYETRVRETGIRFSGGERQRIALARILLQDCPVVLLDEPTVGLDPITEQKLLNTIFNCLKGKTLLWITHHLTRMDQMDQIIFMDHGRITMRGTHEQLMAQDERYRKLYALDQP